MTNLKQLILEKVTYSDINSNNHIEKINLNDFEIGDRLFKSNIYSLYICKKIKTKKIYSLKVINKAELIKSKHVDYPLNEYQNLSSIYHPFIMEIKGINNTDPYNLYFLNEFSTGGPLKYLLKVNQLLPIEYIKFYSASIITIFDYLHKKNIIYRDLRAENILFNIDGYIKLSDFLLSKKLKQDYSYSLCGLPEYYPPEMINQTGYNKSIDFWQLGILLHEMSTGNLPFIDSDPMKLYQKIKKGKIHFSKNINKNVKNLIKHFLNPDKYKRLGCTKKGIYEIVQHPFFENFDWEGLLHRNLKPPFIPKINQLLFVCNYKQIEKLHLEENCVAIPKEKDPFYNW
jgi:serine/threonine protein kinase